MHKRVRVVHIINSFEFGVAEAMLCNLLLRTDRQRFDSSVVSLIDDLRVAGPIQEAGIPITVIGLNPRFPTPLALMRLVRHVRRAKPQIVQTWMDHSNLIGGIAARMTPGAKVVWGIHHSHHVKELSKRTTLMTVTACARLSRFVPHQIVCCSETSKRLYGEDGFAAHKMTVIPNGFSTERFRPDPSARMEIRKELGVASDAILIGLVARYDPLKDHANFIEAAGLLHRQYPAVRFLLCGANVDSNNAALMQQISDAGISGVCHLLGPRHDVPKIHAALDILTSSSISEAFPLTLGEAMSCGTPCVATDVGDSAFIVGPTGKIVPKSDSAALCDAWVKMLKIGSGGREQLGRAARQRVEELFDLGAVTRRYEALYNRLAGAESASAHSFDGTQLQSIPTILLP